MAHCSGTLAVSIDWVKVLTDLFCPELRKPKINRFRFQSQKVVSANCLIIGGPGSGKTSLSYSYETGTFLNQNQPSELIVQRTIEKRGKTLHLRLIDTGPVYSILELGPKLMSAIDVIIFCFDVSDRGSMETALNLLSYIELHSTDCMCCESYCATKNKVPKLVVVGNKADLRTNQEKLFEMFDSKKTLVSRMEGQSFSEGLRADLYHEVSALYHDGVDELFDEIHNLFFPTILERFHDLSKKISMPLIVL